MRPCHPPVLSLSLGGVLPIFLWVPIVILHMSQDTAPSNDALEQLMFALSQAQRDRRAARNWMSILLLVVLAVFLYLGYVTVQTFSTDDVRMEAFYQALEAELSDDLGPLLESELREAAETVLPAYQDALTRVVERDADKYSEMLGEEFVELEAHLYTVWPKIQEGIAEMAIQQEEVTRNALMEYISPDQLYLINEAYSRELNLQMEQMIEQNFGQEIIIGQNLFDKLALLAAEVEDPGLDDTQFILGMMIELLGYEMQANAAELSGAPEAETVMER